MHQEIFRRLAGYYTPFQALCVWLAVANVTAFLLFGLDKWKAKRKRLDRDVMRIPERTLIGWALAGGSVGAILGMRLFRHKTRKAKFAVGLPLILFGQVLIPLLWYLRGRYLLGELPALWYLRVQLP